MSNTSIGLAKKGSKYQMQRLTLKENLHYLNSKIGESLIWISPVKEEEFREYQLNNKKISKRLDLKEDAFIDFWPSRQSQWDGIAIGESGTLYLFEAKSHLSEIQPGKEGKSEGNNHLKYTKRTVPFVYSFNNFSYLCTHETKDLRCKQLAERVLPRSGCQVEGGRTRCL